MVWKLGIAALCVAGGLLAVAMYGWRRRKARVQSDLSLGAHDAARPGAGLEDRGLVQRLWSGPEFGALRGFFGGTFHEDWSYDFPDDDAAVSDFIETAQVFPEDIEAVRAEMDALLALGMSDGEMDEALDVLGCSYKPLDWPAVPWEANAWVRSIREMLD